MRKSKSYKQGSSEQGSAQDRALDRFAEMMIEKIESIQKDWHKPWFSNTAINWPRNLDGRNYNGMNSLMLMWHCESKGYKYPVFVTFDRVMSMNFKKNADGSNGPATDKDGNKLPRVAVAKGEKSFPVFITTFTVIGPDGKKMKMEDYRKLSKDDQDQCKVFPKNQVYNVFNIVQTNMKEARPEIFNAIAEQYDNNSAPANKDGFRFEPVDKMIKDNLWFCPIKPTYGDNAYFSLTKDEIVVPTYEQFTDGESFYSNLFHEMAHSTGHKDRLNRLQKASFGSPEYAKEELVAELTAALVAQMYGMSKHVSDDSAAYLKSWLKSLKEDASFINSVLVFVKHAASMINKKIDEVADSAKQKKAAEDTLVEQYKMMKDKHPDAILLFRCGDFYEMMFDDAAEAANILGITLSRPQNGHQTAGFPHYALDTYLPKLIRAGKRVAICDQLSA